MLRNQDYVRVAYGEHAGRAGLVVSTPWLVNVASRRNGWWGGLERDWVTVWCWELERADPPR